MLTVKNKNHFDFTGRYNGHDYVFPAGSVVAVPEDAAAHIFGVGYPDKTDVLVRHGWMQTSIGRDNAMSILNRFSFNVADTLSPGEVVELEEPEQGSAPLQTGSGGEEEATDVAEEYPPQPTSKGGEVVEPEEEEKGSSILDTLNNLGR